jgi:hypothetical protein
MSDLGRLIRTLSRKCPSCNHPLQLRERKVLGLVGGEEIEKAEEYICCSVCDYDEEVRDSKKRVVHFDKTHFILEKKEKSNANDYKRNGIKSGNFKGGRGSYRGNN